MDIVLTRILECMGNKYGSGKDLADFLGISGNVITNWKNGSNHSYLKHLKKLLNFTMFRRIIFLERPTANTVCRHQKISRIFSLIRILSCLRATLRKYRRRTANAS